MRRKRAVIDLINPRTQRQVVAYSLRYPSHRESVIKAAMKRAGVTITNTEIRSIWQKYHLSSFVERLAAMESSVKQELSQVASA